MRSRVTAALAAALSLGMAVMPPALVAMSAPQGHLQRRPGRGHTVRSDQRQAQKRANVRRNRTAHKRAARK